MNEWRCLRNVGEFGKRPFQRMGWLLSVATLLLIGGGIGGWLYRRNKIKQSAEAEDRIDTLARMLEEAQKTIAEEESDMKSISSNAEEPGSDWLGCWLPVE